eukprot:6452352-Karenia_brevis.AAC.1
MQDPGLERELSVAIHLDPCSHERRSLVSILLDRRFCSSSSGRAVFARVAKSLFSDLVQKDLLQQLWSRQCALLKEGE